MQGLTEISLRMEPMQSLSQQTNYTPLFLKTGLNRKKEMGPLILVLVRKGINDEYEIVSKINLMMW